MHECTSRQNPDLPDSAAFSDKRYSRFNTSHFFGPLPSSPHLLISSSTTTTTTTTTTATPQSYNQQRHSGQFRHAPTIEARLDTQSLLPLHPLHFHSASAQGTGWRPDTERPGTPFVLGNGKNEGVKVVGYEGEWPLWSHFHADEKKQAEGAEAIDAVSPRADLLLPLHMATLDRGKGRAMRRCTSVQG